jgi:hypothetical protein
MVIRQTQRRIWAKRFHQCTCLWQPQRSIGQTRTPSAFNQQRCEVWIQPPYPSVMSQINPRSLNGSYEYHDAKYDQRNWSNHPKKIDSPTIKVGNGAWERPSTAESEKNFFRHAVLDFAFVKSSTGQSPHKAVTQISASSQPRSITSPHISTAISKLKLPSKLAHNSQMKEWLS